MKDDSKCPKNILCAFRGSRDLPDALIEVCENCGKKVVYNKADGEIDDAKYLRDHIRDTLQPYGRTGELFRQIYGMATVQSTEKMLKTRKSKKQLQDEWDETRKDARSYISKRVLGAEVRGTDWN